MKEIKDDELLINQAMQYLNDLFQKNSANELDLPCSADELKSNWSVKNNLNDTYSVINHLYHNDNFVAKYEIIFNKDKQVIDEFFITQ